MTQRFTYKWMPIQRNMLVACLPYQARQIANKYNVSASGVKEAKAQAPNGFYAVMKAIVDDLEKQIENDPIDFDLDDDLMFAQNELDAAKKAQDAYEKGAQLDQNGCVDVWVNQLYKEYEPDPIIDGYNQSQFI